MSKRTNIKKIALVGGFYLPHLGGVERYMDKLGAALQDRGYEVIIVTSKYDSSLTAIEEVNNKRVYRLPVFGMFRNRYPIPKPNKEYRNTLKKIKAKDIDLYILNTRFHLAIITGMRLGRRAKRPVVLVEHGTDHFSVGIKVLDFFGKYYEHALTWYVKKGVDAFYGVSQKCNEWLRHFNITARGVFYNAVDVSDYDKAKIIPIPGVSSGDTVVSYAGRVMREKGVVNLLDAFVLSKEKQNKSVKLIIAGDGPILSDLKNIYNRSDILFVGRLDFNNVMSLYKQTDIFVYPSLYPEGLPTSILEAGLMDCAVIATPRGGTEEVIENGRHGIIVDGSVQELKRSLGLLLCDVKLRQNMAHKLKTRIEEAFSWESVAGMVEKEIKKMDIRNI